jgi:uncharacterized repeat protein (TIGR01451 family)
MESRNPLLRRRVPGSLRSTAPAAATGMLLLALLAVLAITSRSVTAFGPFPQVGGPIVGLETWDQAGSPYVVTETVEIQAGGTLIIEPGVEVYFDAGTGIWVAGDGQLLAEGADAEQILFTSHAGSPAPGDWNGISFASSPDQSSILRYCIIEWAGTAVTLADTDFVIIDHCTLRYNGDGGDLNTGGAVNSAGDNLTISNNLIHDNEFGLRLQKSIGVGITGNVIRDNGEFAIGFFDANSFGGQYNTVVDNDIFGNGGFGIGFVLAGVGYEGGSKNSIRENDIHDNGGFGIGFINTRSNTVPDNGSEAGSDNTISNNQIYGNSGFGIGFVNASTGEQSQAGSENSIINNSVHDNSDSAEYPGDGLYMDTGTDNIVTGNLAYNNAGHGVWIRDQLRLQLTGNVVRGNVQTGLTLAEPNTDPTALHSNVLCSNFGFQLQNLSTTAITAEGNWFGTNTPGAGQIDGSVDYDPWIVMDVTANPGQLPADGLSKAILTVTMLDGASHAVPDGYEVTLTASAGMLDPSTLSLFSGQATSEYTADTVPGTVSIEVTDGCTTTVITEVLILQAVDLAVQKTGPPGPVHPGDQVTYAIRISELNTVNARELLVTDILPVGATYVSDTGAGCGLTLQSAGANRVWTKDQWDGGASCEFELTVEAGREACPDGVMVNRVEVTSAAADGNPANNYAEASTPIECLDLAVSKDDGDGAVLVLEPTKMHLITYTVTYTNGGEVMASGVVLTDVLPPGTRAHTSPGWTCDGRTCTHPLGTVPPNGPQTAPPLLAEVLACGDLRNEVTIGDDGSHGLDMNPEDNLFVLTTTVPCLPDLRVVKNDNVGPEPDARTIWLFNLMDLAPEQTDPRECVRPGELITYSIAYANTGLETATTVVLTETLPEYTSYVGGGWDCDGRTCTLTVDDLPPGAGGKADFIVHVDIAPPDLLVLNEIRIGSAEPDAYPPDNYSSDDTPICEVCLEITKEDNLPCAMPGDEIRYTIAFTNVCDSLATGVVLTETLPDHTSYLTSPGWVLLDGDQFTYAYGTLDPGQSASVEFAVMVDDPLPDTVTETVDIVCVGRDGSIGFDACATEITPLPLVADLRVVKHDHIGPQPAPDTLQQLDRFYQLLYDQPYRAPSDLQDWEPVKPGDIYSYTITYLNLGRVPATGVVLTETLPAHTIYVGYGWTQVSSDTFVYEVGDLAVREGGQRNFWVQVDPDACGADGYLYNWVYIGGDVEECNLSNNWSGEETPVDLPPCEGIGTIYLPLVLKAYAAPVTPTPTPTTPPPTPEAYVSDVAVNPETNRVYVASPQVDAVFAVDPTGVGSIIATIPVGDHPSGLAVVTTTNKIYAANLRSHNVTAIRGSDHTPIRNITVGVEPSKAAADSGDGRVYVSHHKEIDNGAAAINSQTDDFMFYYTRMHASQGRYGIDVDPEQEKLFIAARDAGLIVMQDTLLPNQEPLNVKLDPPRVPYVVAFNPATGHLFVTAADDNLVVVLDPYSIQWNQGRWLYLRGQPVFVLNRTNAGWIKEIGVGAGAEEGIAVNPLTGYVYVTNAYDDTVSILQDDADPANIRWIKDLKVGEYPQGVDVNITTNRIYVGNAESRDLTEIDGNNHTVLKTIPLY